MKKSPHPIIILTIVFISLVAGVFIGRSTAGVNVTLTPSSDNDPGTTVQSQGSDEIGKVNINTADINELTLLPGIGQTKAESIIIFRENYGRFTRIEDLIYVDGFSYTTIEELRPYITTGG